MQPVDFYSGEELELIEMAEVAWCVTHGWPRYGSTQCSGTLFDDSTECVNVPLWRGIAPGEVF